MSVKYKRVKQKDGTFRHQIVRDKPRKVEVKADDGQEDLEQGLAEVANSEDENEETPAETPKKAKSKGKGDAGAKK